MRRFIAALFSVYGVLLSYPYGFLNETGGGVAFLLQNVYIPIWYRAQAFLFTVTTSWCCPVLTPTGQLTREQFPNTSADDGPRIEH